MSSLFKIVGIIAEGLLHQIIGKPAPRDVSTRQRSGSPARDRENGYPREQSSPQPPQVRPAEASPVPIKQAAFLPVRNTYTTGSGFQFIPLWQKLGWRVNAGNKYQFIGEYRFRDRKKEESYRWEGAIQTGPYEFKVYIRNPPSALQRHEHWRCFNYAGEGWFSVHFINPLDGLDDAILNVQRLIAEAHWFY
jgi:hypothetical protein